MGLIEKFIDVILHLDKYLAVIIADFGPLTYLILFLVVLFETGLVIMPFLPGDSLLFAAGAFASTKALSLYVLLILFPMAAFIGDTMNYWIGYHIGPKVFTEKVWFLKKEHLNKTQKFYEKYGKKTIFLARFIPILRTFAPFVAGIGKMHYPIFLFYNVLGALLWVFFFVLGGYFFGNIPFVQEHFSFFIMGIIILSFIPAIVEFIKHKMNKEEINVSKE